MGGKPVPSAAVPSGNFVAGGQELHPPSLLEQFRQQAVIGVVIGIRQGLASVSPTGNQAVTQDNAAAQILLAQGDYERAFEVATGFPEYFDIKRKGEQTGSSRGEIAAVMMGEATGFNQAMEAKTGQSRDGEKLSSFERFLAGLEGLLKIANTALTVLGGVEVGSNFFAGRFGPAKVVSPVYRIADRDIVIVETSVGRQAFYRSSGFNSGRPGQWFPVDEFLPTWFNKGEYTLKPGLEEGTPLHRLGTREFARISEKLGQMSIPEGMQVPKSEFESAENTLNRVLDFFKARLTPSVQARPLPEQNVRAPQFDRGEPR